MATAYNDTARPKLHAVFNGANKKRKQKRVYLTDTTKSHIVAAYQSGASSSRLSLDYGVPVTSIYNFLKKAGVTPRTTAGRPTRAHSTASVVVARKPTVTEAPSTSNVISAIDAEVRRFVETYNAQCDAAAATKTRIDALLAAKAALA